MRRRAAIVAAALLVAGALQAHDFWMLPSTFHPVTGETVSVALRVGQDFVGDPVPRTGDLIERFVVRQGRREEDVAGMDGSDPAGFFRADGRAAAIVAYASRPTPVEMAPQKFEDYLRQYGLERIIALRMARGEQKKPSHEIFVRCAKTILSGAQPSIAATQPIGLRYEIVPNADPAAGGSEFRGRLVFDRKLLPWALVVAVYRDQPSLRLATRSNAEGAFSFALPRPGVWLIKSVHMIDAPSESGAEWESLWASLTFDWPRR